MIKVGSIWHAFKFSPLKLIKVQGNDTVALQNLIKKLN